MQIVGGRLLRANLLRPYTGLSAFECSHIVVDIATLDTRLDVVEMFLRLALNYFHSAKCSRNNRCFSDVVSVLARYHYALCQDILIVSSFPDLDKMLNGLCNVPKSLTLQTARVLIELSRFIDIFQIGIDTLIFVKHTLLCAPRLAAVLDCLRVTCFV